LAGSMAILMSTPSMTVRVRASAMFYPTHKDSRCFHSKAPGTMKQLTASVTGRTRQKVTRFDKILPTAMDKLLAEGLFEPDGEGSYKITRLGLSRLKELEKSA
jgi:hypothetical protein